MSYCQVPGFLIFEFGVMQLAFMNALIIVVMNNVCGYT